MTDKDFEVVSAKIEEEKCYLNDISQDISKHPELNYKEFHAHELLSNALAKYGFIVTKHYLLPTAFRAEFSSGKGKGPTIAICLEYDALPEIGHACGHNLIAEAGLAAGIGIKHAMEKDSTITGKVVILGTPAEEGGGGKVQLINKGAFIDIDAAMMVHPRPFTTYAPPTLSLISCTVDFKGRESHASAFPWKGLNALDAAVTFYQSVGLLRQQIKPSHRIHAIISKGGVAPNIIPSETQVVFFVRAPTSQEMRELKSKVDKCVEAASLSTGCTYIMKDDEDHVYEHLITNPLMRDLFGRYAQKLGLPELDTAVTDIPAGSTDMGNVSQVVPSIQPVYAINTTAVNHTAKFAEAAASPDAQPPTLASAKAMAMTVLSLFRNPKMMSDVKAQFEDRK